MKDREYLQEIAYIKAKKEIEEWQEWEEYQKTQIKPAKIYIQKDGKREREFTKSEVNTLPF